MIRRLHRDTLPFFLLLSVTLHLCLLAAYRKPASDAVVRYFGQPEVNVALQGVSPSRASSTPSRTARAELPPGKETAPLRSTRAAERVADSPVPASRFDNALNRQASIPSDEPEADMRNQLLGELQTRLSRYLIYPPLARQRGWEGTVWLGLRMEADGQLDRIRIERSSGYAVLDRSALNSLNRIGRLAEASAWFNGRGIDMQLPVIYRLVEN